MPPPCIMQQDYIDYVTHARVGGLSQARIDMIKIETTQNVVNV